MRSAPWETPAPHPLRQLKLINGDSLQVEVLASTAGALDVRWLGQIRFRIPIAAIDHIVSLPGEQDMLSEHFVRNPSRHHAGERGTHPIDGVVAVSAVSGASLVDLPQFPGDFGLSLRLRTPQSFAQSIVRWTVFFSEQHRIRIHRDSVGVWRVSDSWNGSTQRQAVPHRPGWHTLRVQRTSGRFSVSLDEASLYAGWSPAARPSRSEIESSDSPVFVDQLTMVARSSPGRELPKKDLTDAVLGSHGETWWGDVQTVNPDEVVWIDAGQTWRRSWKELQGVLFGELRHPVAGKKLAGTFVSLRLQSLSDRPDLPGDRLTASLGPGRIGFVELQHPLLGRLVVPQRAIQRIEHRHTGRAQLLDARELSLGGPSGDLLRTRPEGQFVLADDPGRGITFVAEFSGLEPSGLDTPPGSRSLQSLRAGRLVTELFVNDRLVGNFNELTSNWSLPGAFDRLSLKVPANHLRPGQNSWRIRQQPGEGTRSRFDDCQIRNIGWEAP